MSVGYRLAIAVRATSGSLRAFATATGVPYRTIQNYVGGQRSPQADVHAQICTRRGISADWLLTGEGEMRRDRPAGAGCATGPPDLPGTAVRGLLRAAIEVAAETCGEDGVRESRERYGVAHGLADLAAILADLPTDAATGIIAEALSRASSARELARLRQAVADIQAAREPDQTPD